ncbi:thiamine-phosphate kinase [Marinigracilibium pacificum]|uniref:Thiamine-monophosphate kinase n=1 Tax=Marinigracilibium pacificum TaxID=2729599 RepID=A0A848J078_9BACT|nr:thiamine-phosphate kinase [Marinigracilibium pacificum]NMM48925.1 thiamine-phosphate kinase [Marinigracilibium pacificum]
MKKENNQQENNTSRTELGKLGEFGLIDAMTKDIKIQNKETKLGVGDDAAVIDIKEHSLITSDMLLEGIHFDLSYTPLTHLGYKAVSVNISDIAAMNGIPKQITVNLGLSNRFSVEAVNALYQGIYAACDDYNVDLIGGDTTSSAAGLVISITAIGEQAEDKIVKRSTAKESDIICVSGDLGGAFMGLNVLQREKEVFKSNPDMQPDIDKYSYVVERQLKPKARMDVVYELKELGILPTSMIDISDGLASELFHIATQSGLGVQIYEDKLPIATKTYETAVEFNIDPNTAALNGGEDYELLFTITQDDYEKIKNHMELTTIGFMHPKKKGMNFITKNNQVIEVKAQGWQHLQ